MASLEGRNRKWKEVMARTPTPHGIKQSPAFVSPVQCWQPKDGDALVREGNHGLMSHRLCITVYVQLSRSKEMNSMSLSHSCNVNLGYRLTYFDVNRCYYYIFVLVLQAQFFWNYSSLDQIFCQQIFGIFGTGFTDPMTFLPRSTAWRRKQNIFEIIDLASFCRPFHGWTYNISVYLTTVRTQL